MTTKLPRILIAGLSGDSGKTIVSLSLATAFVRRGLAISAFKKGPDYIDAAWLGYASKSICRNLDTYLIPEEVVYNSFCINSADVDISLIEGNRGIYDGKDVVGTHSTAGLAKLLQAPVVLVVDVTKTTRTVAAMVKGIIEFDKDVTFAGVVLNKVGGARHQNILTETIEKYCDLPVLGAIPKLGSDDKIIPGRHLGLVTPAEYDKNSDLEYKLYEIANTYLNIDKILELANNASPLDIAESSIEENNNEKKAKIGYFKDSVFTFYYPENLERLENAGAELIAISSTEDEKLPAIDGLYIGGGFPETQAEKLSSNQSMLNAVRKAAVDGMPVYAECGGLIYLARSLNWADKTYQMAGVFPVDLTMHEKPVGHGYTELRIDEANPFFETGTVIKGHEFHYSGVAESYTGSGIKPLTSVMQINKGVGLGNKRDGLLFNNTLACYTHIHASGVEYWAGRMVESARKYRSDKSTNPSACKIDSVEAKESRNSGLTLLMAES